MIAGKHAGRPFLVVDALGLQQLLDQPRLVVGVEDGEVALQPDQLGMAAQHPHADRMEGAEPHAVGRAADQAARRGRSISRAALLVKVTARICDGRARPVINWWAMRVVSTRVLPVPAPASTSSGPPSWMTASALLLVQPLEMGRRRNGTRRAGLGAGNGIVGDFKRVGGGRHTHHIAIVGPRRLSLTRKRGGFRMARGLNGSANGSSQWHGNERGVEARRPGGESNLPPEVVDVLPAVVGVAHHHPGGSPLGPDPGLGARGPRHRHRR